jgi:rhamnosyltransferase
MPQVSIIIRTKNEERWIGHCLSMIFNQDFKDFEVILVDNASTDHTVEVAKRYPLAHLINIDRFRPGHAINEGIRVSSGRFIVCLSAHCIPKNTDWLTRLLSNFKDDPKLAGVYGRQLPVSFTDPVDKRDLLIVFGQDRRVQVKDYFFHNANSMLRKDVWEAFPFDEEVTNIEDRVWGKAITTAGYHIVYDPEAAVYHHHGLHQGNMPQRAKGVVSIIERVDEEVANDLPPSLKPENINVAAVLPVFGEIEPESQGAQLLEESIAALYETHYVNNIYVLSYQEKLAKGGVCWINRSTIPDVNNIGMDELMQQALRAIESRGDYPEALLYVNYEYLSRPQGLFDELIFDAQYRGYETVFPGFIDYGHLWVKTEDGDYKQTDSSLKLRTDREPIYRALYGLGCVSSSAVVRSGKLISKKVGIIPVNEFSYTVRLRDRAEKDHTLT